ncbi:hypothetical protein BH18ACT1_BH18ACT1_10240 [soil metagenome]
MSTALPPEGSVTDSEKVSFEPRDPTARVRADVGDWIVACGPLTWSHW